MTKPGHRIDAKAEDQAAALAYAKETFRLLLDDERARRAMGPLYSRCVEAIHRIQAVQ